MKISSINNGSYPTPPSSDTISKVKQSMQDLGSALDSGSVSSAKSALSQLQSNLPTGPDGGKGPLADKFDSLSKSLDSGDLKSAQSTYADIKQTASQRPSGPPPGMPAGNMGQGMDFSPVTNKGLDATA